jgi:3-isopropylmalate/(R)-2-methylmalate dehydratase small subunit
MDLHTEITGSVWLLGDHVNTDMLHPPDYFSLDPARLKEGIREGRERLKTAAAADAASGGIVIVAGENFGCGSSRETSVRALQACGLKAVAAKSFARIFHRSLTNLGIPALVCSDIQQHAADGDPIAIALHDSSIKLRAAQRYSFAALDTHVMNILACGGLAAYLQKELHGL